MLTNLGRDYLAAQMVGGTYGSLSPTTTALAKYIAVTSDSTAPALTDTTLTGEISSTNGLGRTLATSVTHVQSSSSYALTNTFTYTGSTSVTINKIGIFNAVSGGQLIFETAVATAATVTTNGDTLTITQNVSLP